MLFLVFRQKGAKTKYSLLQFFKLTSAVHCTALPITFKNWQQKHQEDQTLPGTEDLRTAQRKARPYKPRKAGCCILHLLPPRGALKLSSGTVAVTSRGCSLPKVCPPTYFSFPEVLDQGWEGTEGLFPATYSIFFFYGMVFSTPEVKRDILYLLPFVYSTEQQTVHAKKKTPYAKAGCLKIEFMSHVPYEMSIFTFTATKSS